MRHETSESQENVNLTLELVHLSYHVIGIFCTYSSALKVPIVVVKVATDMVNSCCLLGSRNAKGHSVAKSTIFATMSLLCGTLNSYQLYDLRERS